MTFRSYRAFNSMQGVGSQLGPSAFGSLLRRYRIAAGLSQEGLAERARISMQAVGALERGHRRAPQRETLSLLVEALALDPEQRASFEAVARQSAARAIARGVTEGPWPSAALPMLPLALTSFVGHASTLREVADLLRTHRLVTLNGPGGIGKTRIALEVGSRAVASGEVVRLVELAAVADPTHVVSSIAAALHIQSVPSQPLLDTITSYLQRERVLLVLDNCEHVIDEAARVAERLLRACSLLRIFATSREPLRVGGEIVYRVPALEVPNSAEVHALDADRARSYSAVALFVDRAQAADIRFTLTDATAPAVTSICAQLDGLPLAIELAAARVTTLKVATMAQRLGRRFDLLSHGERTVHARHRTMRNAIAWSYEMLTEPEQRLFERMSIFAGGCTLDAARTVCAGDGLEEFEIDDLIDSLVEKSLITITIVGRQTRFGMLETFREFAREKLAVRESSGHLARAHARVYAQHYERLFVAFQTEPEDEVFAAVRADLENWRTAIAWAFGPSGDSELGQNIYLSGHIWVAETEEGRHWLDLALARIDVHTASDIVVGLAFCRAQIEERLFGNEAAVVENAERSLAYFDSVCDKLSAARASFRRGSSLLQQGRLADAESEIDAALERARGCGSLRLAGYALTNVARLALAQGELEKAQSTSDEALGVFERLRSLIGRSLSLQILSEIALRRGDPETALLHSLRDLEYAREHNDPVPICVALNNVSAFLIALNRFEDALVYFDEQLELATRFALKPRILWALHHLAAIEALRPRDAEDEYSLLRAARIMGHVDARLAEIGRKRDYTDRQEYERVLAALGSLEVAQREAAFAAGAAMTQAEAIDEARGAAFSVVPRS